MAEARFDCIVIGSGPGGYVAAIRAAQLGLNTAVVERETPGGICLNWGCIPTKALLKSAELYQTLQHAESYGIKVGSLSFDFPAIVQRSRQVVDRMTKGVQFLFKKNKITLIAGEGRLAPSNFVVVKDRDGKDTAYEYRDVIIATGARARTIANLPVDGERVITYRHALALKSSPQKLLVVGAGAIGVEFAYFYNAFGAEVTLVEALENVLPIEDHEVSQALEKSFKKQKIDVRTKTTVDSLTRTTTGVNAILRSGDRVDQWNGDYCLVAIGVAGNVENLGLETSGIRPDRSFIKVDQYYRTGVPHIYAIGDVIGPPWLAHVASHEGIIAAEFIANHRPQPIDYNSIPGCTYCIPQVASIGLSEKAAEKAARQFKVGRFPFSASGKAVAANETEGFVKVVIDSQTEEVLGVHIIHPEATELIAEPSVIRSLEGTATSVISTIHAHPTLSEAVMEAMADALGRAIHI